LKNTLEAAKEQMAPAAKAAKMEARSKVTPKTAPVPPEHAGAETKKPADAAPKPAEPRKQEPARNASLFDIGPSPEPAPLSASDADEEEEILAEADDEPMDEPDDLDEAAQAARACPMTLGRVDTHPNRWQARPNQVSQEPTGEKEFLWQVGTAPLAATTFA
jgi:hypothetical protein